MIPFHRSKTFWFSLLTIVTAVAALFGFQDFQPDSNTQDILLLVVGIVNLVLRLLPARDIASPLTRR